jgi:hypothetical protein
MSSGVSQIDNWLGTSSKNTPAPPPATAAAKGGPGATFLSYDVYLGLAVLGGFFALDHLYLRSPLTFLAKFVVNILCFGVWWIYDASLAFFNKDTIKVFGLSVPGIGPKGIAAGVLSKDVPDEKHMRFFFYSVALLLGGIFGLDSFVLGDKQSGLIRLVSLITVIFAPVALGWWAYKLFKFFFQTKSVVEENYDFFGAPEPSSLSPVNQLVEKIPALGPILGPLNAIKNALVGTVETAGEIATAAVQNPQMAATLLQESPVGQVAKPVLNTVQSGINTVKSGINTVNTVIQSGTTLAQEAIDTAGAATQAATAALQLAPQAAALSAGITPGAIQQAKLKMEGGGPSNALSYTMVGTLAAICVLGMFLTYRRSKKNERPAKDDRPPEPGVL